MIFKRASKKGFIIVMTFVLTFPIAGQTLIENRNSPVGRNPGRVLKMEVVLRVKEMGPDFFFKRPWGFAAVSDGSFFVGDGGQLLKFSPDGTFIKNLVRPGQGPGEISDFCSLRSTDDRIFVMDFNQGKVLHFDSKGPLVGELRLRGFSPSDFFGVIGGRFLFADSTYPPPQERKSQLYDILTRIVFIENPDIPGKVIATFRPKRFLMPQGAMGWDPFNAALSRDGRSLFVNWTREYRIDKLDVETGKIAAGFQRPFLRVPHIKEPREEEFEKKYHPPPKKYDPDIRQLFPNHEVLWVETSQTDKAQRRLYDAFDDQGRWQDSFYLELRGDLLSVQEGYIFALEQDEAGTLSVVKYRILN